MSLALPRYSEHLKLDCLLLLCEVVGQHERLLLEQKARKKL